MEENKLDYPKEIADMEALVVVLKALLVVRERLQTAYWLEAEKHNRNGFDVGINEGMIADEYLEKSYIKEMDVYQLKEEISVKEGVLIQLRKRANEYNKATELLAKEASSSLNDRIKQAKQLASNNKVPKDVREKLINRFVNPYRKRFKFGFNDDEEKAAFFKALIQIIEVAENWTKPVKK